MWDFLHANCLKISNFSCKYTFCHLASMHTADQIRLRPPLFKSTCIRLRPPSVDRLQASALVHIFAAVPIQPQSAAVSHSQPQSAPPGLVKRVCRRHLFFPLLIR